MAVVWTKYLFLANIERETFSEIDKKAREIKIHREPHGERFFILHRTLKRFREIRVRIRERFKRFKRFKRERENQERTKKDPPSEIHQERSKRDPKDIHQSKRLRHADLLLLNTPPTVEQLKKILN